MNKTFRKGVLGIVDDGKSSIFRVFKPPPIVTNEGAIQRQRPSSVKCCSDENDKNLTTHGSVDNTRL